jgi:hypothetical protein
MTGTSDWPPDQAPTAQPVRRHALGLRLALRRRRRPEVRRIAPRPEASRRDTELAAPAPARRGHAAPRLSPSAPMLTHSTGSQTSTTGLSRCTTSNSHLHTAALPIQHGPRTGISVKCRRTGKRIS